MKPISRRHFIKSSAGAATGLAVLTSGKAGAGANDKIIVGVMGLGGRGVFLARRFAERKDVEIAYVCDPNAKRLGPAAKSVEAVQGKPPKQCQDFRRMLEDNSVDAIINATPDHWHVLGSLLACQAGKDVYVEKPMAYNIFEGRKLIEAVRKYKRVLTVGMQTRSAPYVKACRQYIQSGKLGEIRLVRVFNTMQHSPMKLGPEQPVPPNFDYDLWCGPAQKLPYRPSMRWLNMWEYSCGPIPGDAVHQIDLARYLMGDPPSPKTVMHQGGIEVLKDGRDTPDTQYAIYQYDDFTMLFQGALWMPYMHKIPPEIRDSDRFPDWPWCATRVEICGTKGFMFFGRHGGGWQVFDADNKIVDQLPGRQADAEHIENFIQCIRSRQTPNASVEQGHLSCVVCHMANIAWKVGNKKLTFDPSTETFTDCPEANQYLRRPRYREPWVVPENV
ncbi:MAG: Gfo/Idh/MocA family oxidoreductase [Verrucomicrobiae bacterium]|nr:Gfo/Idh/MocA family oxidoreductase [Verrucomicrobiae bacterium]